MRTSLLIFSSALCALFCGCQKEATPPAKNSSPTPPVALAAVHPKRGDITRPLTLPATILPNQQATLFAKVTGYLQKITVDKGDNVKQGQEIAVIEAPELIADEAKYKADLDVAELDYKRTANAQQKAPDLIVLQSVDAAKAKFLAAKAALERAQTLLGFSKIVAPFSGVVTRRFVDPGAFIPAATAGSSPQNAAIVTIVDSSTVRVQIAVPEPEVPRIKNGLPVRVTVDELPARHFDGTITRDTRSLDETKTMLAEVDLPNPNGELLPGMYATAKIGIEKHANVLTLPIDALVMEKTAAFVFKAIDGKAKKTPIKVGFNDGARFEATDGVAEGDMVLLVGKTAIADGAPVTIKEAQ
jgi:RND family efflux transporter MFP subunit